MMKSTDPVKAYDSIEYGILLPDAVAPPTRRKKRMSWPKCLCLTLLAVIATFVVTSTVCGLWGFFWMKHQVKRFTTDKRVHYPIHELPNAELEIFKDRAKLFYDTVRAGHAPATDLVITEDELNGLVAHSDYLRGNAIVHLTENTFSADLSLPAKGMPGGKGRYFVGSGSFTMETMTEMDQTKITTEMETMYKIDGLEHDKVLFGEFLAYIATDGTKTLNLLQGQFLDWVAPADYIEKHENLLEHMCDDDDDDDDDDDCDCEDIKTFLDGLEQVSIQDKKIVFHARSSGEGRRLRAIKESKNLSDKVSSFGDYARRSLTKMIF